MKCWHLMFQLISHREKKNHFFYLSELETDAIGQFKYRGITLSANNRREFIENKFKVQPKYNIDTQFDIGIKKIYRQCIQ